MSKLVTLIRHEKDFGLADLHAKYIRAVNRIEFNTNLYDLIVDFKARNQRAGFSASRVFWMNFLEHADRNKLNHNAIKELKKLERLIKDFDFHNFSIELSAEARNTKNILSTVLV